MSKEEFKKMSAEGIPHWESVDDWGVGYRISHGDESQDYPIATIKIAFKMPSQELNGRLELGHVKEALLLLLDKNELSCSIALPPTKEN